MPIPKTTDLFDLSHTAAAALLADTVYPWEALAQLRRFILTLGPHLPLHEYRALSHDIWVHRTARVAASAAIEGPVIIGRDTEIRHCAYLRGSVLVGAGCVVGNSTELKNAILFDRVQVPHYNYVGDSILGYKAHMGAGAVTSNLKSDKSLVCIRQEGEILVTGRKKLGALVGDEAEVGCNSVLCPGSVLGRRCQIYPTSCVRGVVAPGHIYKDAQHIVPRT